tara:strand:+ start:999 stop:1199 length:201 start_codon:yes stop_codon:yes gene_type:complete
MDKKLKEEILSRIYDSADYLIDYRSMLPDSIEVCNEKIDIKLNQHDIAKLKNIIWYISHSKLRDKL